VCNDGFGSRLCNLDTSGLPRFRALHARGNTPTSCLVSYSQHIVATTLLELFGLEEEEEGSDPPSLRVQAPLYRRGPGYRLGVWLPGCRLLRGHGLGMGPSSLTPLSDDGNFIKCLSPLDQHLRGICPMLCLGSFRGEGSCPLVGGGRVWLASRLSPASVDLVGAGLLLAKQPLEEFCRLRRLGHPAAESSAGCWRSRPFSRSQPFWPSAMEIPGTSAGRWLCPWRTRIVIPTTLAPKTGEVSWVSMGLRRVLFLAEVYPRPSKSYDSSSNLEIVDLGIKLRGVSPAFSEHAGSRTDPAGGRRMAARRCPAPRDLLSRDLDLGTTCLRAAASRLIGSSPPIFCDNHGGCPLIARLWRMPEGTVANTSWVRCATDPPSLF
jgi:hypothetical protein